MSPVVVMWRCSTCGKWSHAKRRPKMHGRWIRNDLSTPDLTGMVVLLEDRSGKYSHLSGFTDDGGWLVECGPFEEWRAERVVG